MDASNCFGFERRNGKLIVDIDLWAVSQQRESIDALVDALARECKARLLWESPCHETNQESMSRRIKRGIRRAKERRMRAQ